MLLVDPHNPRSQNLYQQLSTFLNLDALSPHLVFGGDGWMLESIYNHGVDTPYLPNAGTLGFLMNDVHNCGSLPISWPLKMVKLPVPSAASQNHQP